MNPGLQPRRFLFLTDDLGGGTGNHLLSMIKHWDKSRWQIRVLSQARLTARVTPDVPIEFAPFWRWFDRYPLAQVRRLMHARRYIAKYAPDLLHCYFFWPIIYGRILRHLGVVKILVENREDEGFNWGKQEYALLRLTRSIPDRVICVSEAVRQVALERELLDPARTLVVHNGVDHIHGLVENKSAIRQQLGISHDSLIVGMVSNFNRSIKGVSFFLDAIPAIVRVVPAARFLILGRGKEEHALREKTKALEIEPYVIFAGYREDVERYYAIMDVSVMTSLSEGLSITLLESMSHGLPVVVTCVGGNPEVVDDGQTGYLVPPRDVSSFVEKVVKLLGNPDLRARMGQEARRRVEQQFQIGHVADRYLAVYSELLEPTRRRSAVPSFSSRKAETVQDQR